MTVETGTEFYVPNPRWQLEYQTDLQTSSKTKNKITKFEQKIDTRTIRSVNTLNEPDIQYFFTRKRILNF